jgi:hypothetical protein
MTNSAKCNLGPPPQPPQRFFTNCKKYSLGELRVLSPQVIITQGVKARQVIKPYLTPCGDTEIESTIDKLYQGTPVLIRQSYFKVIFKKFVHPFKMDDLVSLAICAVHPSDRGGRWKLFKDAFLPVIGNMCKGLVLNKQIGSYLYLSA